MSNSRPLTPIANAAQLPTAKPPSLLPWIRPSHHAAPTGSPRPRRTGGQAPTSRQPRQREYPHPPPPSTSTTTRMINTVSMDMAHHLPPPPSACPATPDSTGASSRPQSSHRHPPAYWTLGQPCSPPTVNFAGDPAGLPTDPYFSPIRSTYRISSRRFSERGDEGRGQIQDSAGAFPKS